MSLARFSPCFFVAAFLLPLLSATAPAKAFPQDTSPALSASPPQIRGFWVDAFNPGIKSAAEIDELLARLKRANCNTVFAQVRKHGDAYYASRYEPRGSDLNDPAFDPLKTLIEKAHAARPRISVHAWVNAAAVGRRNLPLAPGHILARNPAWRSITETGEEIEGEPLMVDPGVPGAAEWTYRVFLDIVRQYDVDGIHFDFIRYGGARWGYAPESVARFNARHGRSGLPTIDDLLWQQWRREQVTALVRKVYANAAAIKPEVIVSAAVITWGDAPKTEEEWTRSSAYGTVYQDWRAWMEEGILDLACPMTYFRADRNRFYQENWTAWVRNHQYRRAATMAAAAFLNSVPDTLELARIAQAPDPTTGKRAAGVLIYSYGGTFAAPPPPTDDTATATEQQPTSPEALFDALPAVFPGNASFPAFAWKTKPTTGHVKGTALTGSGLAAADGAAVTLKGKNLTRTQTADGTGFFAFIDVPPGDYRLIVEHGGETSAPRPVTVAAGEVTTADALLASGDLPGPRLVHGIRREKNGARVLLPARCVTIGTEKSGTRFFIADAPGAPAVLVQLSAPPPLPLLPGDLITLTGTIQKTTGQPLTILADAVQVVGIAD